LGIESLAVSSREVGNGTFDFCHPSAASPALGEVGVNLRGPAGREFAVRRQKHFLIR
jgi:hypothetical protein